jgi:dihydrodipicolinate synthase/N-acetylneuraminate lyase
MPAQLDPRLSSELQRGLVIPACPLALSAQRRFDERRQRSLIRYYLASGAGGLAVGVHTTQFAIRDPKHGLFQPVLRLAADEFNRSGQGKPFARIAGICGPTTQAVGEASFARECGYHAGLLNVSAFRDSSEDEVITHCREVAKVIPLFGFYLNPALGGRVLPLSFWRRFLEIDNVVAIKVAPFDRYRTMDVVRAAIETGRDDVALYTGNDDNIVMDLLSPFQFERDGRKHVRRIVGGLLGHWAVWTSKAVEMLHECHRLVSLGGDLPVEVLHLHHATNDANAAIFDAANGFAGCTAGIHEVLRRQGLFEGIWCLDPKETLGPGQAAEIERVCQEYPGLSDDHFVKEHVDEWLRV